MSIQQLENCFSPELLQGLSKVIAGVPWKYGWASNKSIQFTHWNHDFAKCGVYNSVDVAHKLPPCLKSAWDYLQSEYIGEQDLLRCYTNSHTFGVEGYPHTDSRRDHDKTIVVYMNKNWIRDWGGETMVYDGYKIVHAELPKYNNALIFNGNQVHQARSVTRICPAQRITLMFKYGPRDYDPLRNKIQTFLEEVGANEIKHKDGKLIAHLLRVYDLLKSLNHSDVCCSVGALHSIFGTNIFKTQLLDMTNPDHHNKVEELIGKEALALVRAFGTINRPTVLEESLRQASVVEPDYMDKIGNELKILCAVEAANLYDQKSLKKYEFLSKFIPPVETV